MKNWQSIETAPKIHKDILVSDGENIAIGSYIRYVSKFVPAHHNDNNVWWNVKYWMELPSLPQEKE